MGGILGKKPLTNFLEHPSRWIFDACKNLGKMNMSSTITNPFHTSPPQKGTRWRNRNQSRRSSWRDPPRSSSSGAGWLRGFQPKMGLFGTWDMQTLQNITSKVKKTHRSGETSWLLNHPIWKICSSKWVHLPQFSGWKFQKYLSCHHPEKGWKKVF